MPTIDILCEKGTAAANFCKAFTGDEKTTTFTRNGDTYKIVHASGHLYELKDPALMVPAALQSKIKSWDLANLPWDYSAFQWAYAPKKNADSRLAMLKRELGAADEIVCATDFDPSGEGGSIFANIIINLGLQRKKLSRMYFDDEVNVEALKKSLDERKPIPDIYTFDEYMMSNYRSKWDMLSMQWTRLSTKLANVPNVMIRQGRLKSAMVLLVGDQLRAYNEWKKVPFFQNRFRDENGVIYTDPDETQYTTKTEVPNTFSASTVTLDGTSRKKTAPPSLMDIGTLTAALGSKVKSDRIMAVYQPMYEAGYVSYPRTEDTKISHGQFDEMLPLVDSIAALVGVNPAQLTVRTPRPTHVKDGGAHGANRPGTKVPRSMDELARFGPEAPFIYQTLAKSFLSMFAPDYEYEQQKAHVTDYPSFTGIANVPKAPGWKALFDADETSAISEEETDESASGVGTKATPFVHEGAPSRPAYPTWGWLNKQLVKHAVGTGATRVTTYNEMAAVPDAKHKSRAPLFSVKGQRISLTQAGDMGHRLLPNTRIGDLLTTKQLFDEMKLVAKKEFDPEKGLAAVADMIRTDLEAMKTNATTMRKELNMTEVAQKEKYEGTFNGKPVRFSREWGGVRFTDEQCEALCRGEAIEITRTYEDGNTGVTRGRLTEQTFNGHTFYGFEKMDAGVPAEWSGHTFTVSEKQKLEAGEEVFIEGFVSKKTGKTFSCALRYGAEEGKSGKRLIPNFNAGLPTIAFGHTLSEGEKQILRDGGSVHADDFYSAKKKKNFSADLTWKEGAGFSLNFGN